MDVLNTFHHTLLVWRRYQWFHQDRVPFLLVTAHVSRSRALPYLCLNCQKARRQAHCLLKQEKCIKIYRSVIYRRVLLLYCIENIKMLLFLPFTGQVLDKFGSVTGSQIEVAKRWGLGKERLKIFSSSLLCSHWPRLKKMGWFTKFLQIAARQLRRLDFCCCYLSLCQFLTAWWNVSIMMTPSI